MKELRLAGINDMAAGNVFLPGFIQRFNERSSVPTARTEDLHRPVRLSDDELSDILCHREQRYVGAQLTFHYDHKQVILEQTEVTKGLAGQYVDLYDFTNRPMEVRLESASASYQIFHKDQRVSHTTVVENKRLGHAQAIVKAQQDLKQETKVLTNSEKTGYKKRPRQVYGPDYVESTWAKTSAG